MARLMGNNLPFFFLDETAMSSTFASTVASVWQPTPAGPDRYEFVLHNGEWVRYEKIKEWHVHSFATITTA